MDDKHLMENLLLLEKGVCDLYLHGTLESPSDSVHTTFQSALTASLNLQDRIYDQMEAKGWYPTEKVEQRKIDSVKQKFQAM